MKLTTLTDAPTLTTATFPITFRQQGSQWIATWSDPEIGTYEVTAGTKATAESKAMRQQRETAALKTVESWMDALKAKGLLPDLIDTWLTDALFTS